MNRVIMLFLIFILTFSANSFAVSDWTKASPLSADQAADIGTLVQTNNTAVDRLLSNYRENCAIYYISTSSVGIKAGEVTCSNSDGSLRQMRANTTALTLTWSNIDTGAEATGTTYYVYAVADADSANFTGMISASATAPTGATYYKKLGTFYNNASGNIVNDDSLVNYSNYYALRLGDWVSKSGATAYQASTDGFLSVSSSTDDNTFVLSDSANPPTTQIGESNINTTGGKAFVGVMIKKNDYYKTDNAADVVYWIPLSREV